MYFNKKISCIEKLRETESDFRFVYCFLIHPVVRITELIKLLRYPRLTFGCGLFGYYH